MQFDDFGLHPSLLRVLDTEEIHCPTPIQHETIPAVLAGRDVVAVAQTGTGKTLAYVLPALTRLAEGRIRANMMLVLAPTRELAQQVHEVIVRTGKPLGIGSAAVYGGMGYGPQIDAFKRGVAVVVATPGRLLDHMHRGHARFNDLVVLILDEADRMLDMGFLPDIRSILRRLPTGRQTVMCSATFPREIARLADEFLKDPQRIEVGQIAKPVETLRQLLYTVEAEGKLSLLRELLLDENIDSAMIFVGTKPRTERVAKALRKHGFKVQALHGDRSQRQRNEALAGFRSGKYRYLVATDVAARGLDIEAVSHVINFDIPENAEDYIHRIGRTARASADGDALTFVSPSDHLALEAIERALGRNLPRADWEGAVPVISLFQASGGETARGRHGISYRRRRSGLFKSR
ncbi:MAG TPA: DEAD/DEAH box helicase [Candidatus Hydrogenedentes bacterium]|nr:DEAD/DEAH box helicase [Candidatus Hydrogenedentota bacterium]